MKNRIWLLLLTLTLGVSAFVMADVSTTATMWLSSRTATNDTAVRIPCSTVPNGGGCRLHGVLVGVPGTASTITIYNSSSTAVNTFAVLTTTTSVFYPFDVYLSSGLVYTTAGAGIASVNILYGKPTFR